MSKQVCVASKIDIWGENLFLDILIFLLCKESYCKFWEWIYVCSVKFPTHL